MTWFKVDDAFYRGPKVRRLGADRLPAVGLWTLAGNWAADNIETNVHDGFVPWEIIQQWDPKRRHAQRLLDVGLWEPAEHGGEPGIQFHDWPDYQPTAEQVRAERAAASRRQALFRDPVLRDMVRARDQDRCRYCGKTVHWGDRRGTHGGTYDPIDPAGPNTVDNLVVCCRGCNSSKGRRTPEQAGMALLGLNGNVTSYATRSEPSPNQNGTKPQHVSHTAPSRPVPKGLTLGGERPVSSRAREERPPDHCPRHRETPAPGPCGACADARRAAQTWDQQAEAAAQAERERLTAALDQARTDPRLRCHHGTDAGRYLRPDTGTSPCALCRAEQAAGAEP